MWSNPESRLRIGALGLCLWLAPGRAVAGPFPPAPPPLRAVDVVTLDIRQTSLTLEPERRYEMVFPGRITNASLDEPLLANLDGRDNFLTISPKTPGATLLYVWLASGDLKIYRVTVSHPKLVPRSSADVITDPGANSLYSLTAVASPNVLGSHVTTPVPLQLLFLGHTPMGAASLASFFSYRLEGEKRGLDRGLLDLETPRYSLLAGDTHLSVLQFSQFVSSTTLYRGVAVGTRQSGLELKAHLGRRQGPLGGAYFDPASEWLGGVTLDYTRGDVFHGRVFGGGQHDQGQPQKYFFGGSALVGDTNGAFGRAEALADPKRVYGNFRIGYRHLFAPPVEWITNPALSHDLDHAMREISGKNPATESADVRDRISQFGSPDPVDAQAVARPQSGAEIVRRKMASAGEEHLAAPTELSGALGAEIVPSRLDLPSSQVASDVATRSVQAEVGYSGKGRKVGNRLSAGFQENQTEQLGLSKVTGRGSFVFDSLSLLVSPPGTLATDLVTLSYGYDYFQSVVGSDVQIHRHQVGLGYQGNVGPSVSSTYQVSLLDAGTEGVADHSLDYRFQATLRRPISAVTSLTFDGIYSYGKSFVSPSLDIRDQISLSLLSSYRPSTKLTLDTGIGFSAALPHSGPATAIHYALFGLRWVPRISHALDVRWSSLYHSIPAPGVTDRFQNYFTFTYTFTFGSAVPGGPFGLDDDSRTIEGQAFLDANFNGVRDPNEPAMPGIRVTLDGSASGITDRDGHFAFRDVPPGKHMVSVNATELQKTYDFSTPSSYSIEWGPGMMEHIPKIRFGFGKTAQVNALVFDDEDGDGKPGVGESGIPLISGKILGMDRRPLGTWQSGANGEVRLPALAPGAYRIALVPDELPNGYQLAWEEQEFRVPERGYVVVLVPMRSLRSLEIKFQSPRGIARVARRPLTLECATRTLTARTDERGEIFFRHVPAERCRATLVLSDGKPFEFVEEFTVRPESRQQTLAVP